MINQEREDWAKELNRIANKIDELASDLTEDKYSQATQQIKKELEACRDGLDFVIKNIK